MQLDQKTKDEILNAVFDMLVMKPGVQEKLYGDPIIITVKGLPVPVSIFHKNTEAVICLSKQSKIHGLYIPVTNRLKALRFMITSLFLDKTIERYETTWEEVYRFLSEVSNHEPN